MSAYSEQLTEFKDADLLCEALKAMGISEIIRHDQPVQLRDYMNKLRPETAEIVIPRKTVGPLSNEIGFSRNDSGAYGAIISEYDAGSNGFNSAWLTKLKAQYAEAGVMRQAKRNGLRFTGKKTVNGKTQLQFVKV